MKITARDLAAAIMQLSMLKYFPSGDAQKAIAIYLRTICSNVDQLGWLVAQLVNHVGEWPGPAQVRGLLCSRFRPADGIEADCTLSGYTATDGESQTLAIHTERKLLGQDMRETTESREESIKLLASLCGSE